MASRTDGWRLRAVIDRRFIDKVVKFIDSHAHIDAPAFDADRDQVIAAAVDSGVELILDIGAAYPEQGTFDTAIALSEKYDCIYLAFGFHPHHARLYDPEWEERLLRLSSHPKVIAWGEIGLDYYYDNSPREVQRKVFRRQLHLARQRQLPVVIHTREAEEDTLNILRAEWPAERFGGILHCFTGTQEMAQACLELGFTISFSGIVTFKKAEELRKVVRQTPVDRILIETDCPFLAPSPHRGKRNEPAYVRYVAQHVAALKGLSEEELGRITGNTFYRIFDLRQRSVG